MKFVLDATSMQTKEEIHLYLKKALSLPDYYGSNLDALYDCISDMNHPEIELHNLTDLEQNHYLLKVLSVMKDAGAIFSDAEFLFHTNSNRSTFNKLL